MVARNPIVIVSGAAGELPSGDLLTVRCAAFAAKQQTTNVTLSNSTWTDLSAIYTDEEFDHASAFASGAFTAPVAGVYVFSGSFYIYGHAGRVGVSIAVNGTSKRISMRSAASNGNRISVPIGDAQIQLAQGDVVKVYGFQDSGASKATESTSVEAAYFSGRLVTAV